MKENFIHELKIMYNFLKIEPADQIPRKAYQRFGSTIHVTVKIDLEKQSKGGTPKKSKIISKRGAKNRLGNDILI